MTPGRIEEAGARGRIRPAANEYLLGPLTEGEVRAIEHALLDYAVHDADVETAYGKVIRARQRIEAGESIPVVRGEGR